MKLIYKLKIGGRIIGIISILTSIFVFFNPSLYTQKTTPWILLIGGVYLILFPLLIQKRGLEERNENILIFFEKNKLIKLNNWILLIIIAFVSGIIATIRFYKLGVVKIFWLDLVILLLVIFIQYSKGILYLIKKK